MAMLAQETINQFPDQLEVSGPESGDRMKALVALRTFITAGGYNPGDRLPAERELTKHLGISRTRLRWCLETLEREGKIWRHVGKGTFLAAEGTGGLSDLSHRVTPMQMMRARFTLEPALAREAAINASGEALDQIVLCGSQASRAGSWEEYESCDDRFHRSVAAATGNVVLLSLFDRLNQVRRAVAWNTVVRESPRPPEDHPSFAEHDRIVAAIKERNHSAAHSAMQDHLGSVSNRLFGES